MRERVPLPDSDFIDLDWVNRDHSGQPTVLVIHGLEGSSRSPYALGLMRAIENEGWRGVVMNLRGCSGDDNRLSRAYHSGDTEDVDYIVKHALSSCGDHPLAVVGYSIGGNMLLKWLGEERTRPDIACAIAVSVPFNLGACTDVLSGSLFRIYENYFMKRLKARIARKMRTMAMPVTANELSRLRSIRQFDDAITSRLHGFSDADDYYNQSSCRQYLGGITANSLIIHAADDPFMTPEVTPRTDELGPGARLELYDRGGHVGFVSGAVPGKAKYWLEQRIKEYIKTNIAG